MPATPYSLTFPTTIDVTNGSTTFAFALTFFDDLVPNRVSVNFANSWRYKWDPASTLSASGLTTTPISNGNGSYTAFFSAPYSVTNFDYGNASLPITSIQVFDPSRTTTYTAATLRTTYGFNTTMAAVDNAIRGTAAGDVLVNSGPAPKTLYGLAGADVLSGNGGATTFRYETAADSTVASPDTILNFRTGLDRINIDGLVTNRPIIDRHFWDFSTVHYDGPTVLNTAINVYGDINSRDFYHGTFGGFYATYRYLADKDSTTEAYDIITDFRHAFTLGTSASSGYFNSTLGDLIDLSTVAARAIVIEHTPAGWSNIYYGTASGVTGNIAVYGDVQASDVIAPTYLRAGPVYNPVSIQLIDGIGGHVLEGNSARINAQATSFVYRSALDSTTTSFDTIQNFIGRNNGIAWDTIDVTAAARGQVLIQHVGNGWTTISYDTDTTGVTGSISVFGDVEGDNLITSSGLPVTLIGGLGAQRLTHAAGATTFKYVAASDSIISAYDTIIDFRSGIDKIDLGDVVRGKVVATTNGQGYTNIAFVTSAGATGAIAVQGNVAYSDFVGVSGVAVGAQIAGNPNGPSTPTTYTYTSTTQSTVSHFDIIDPFISGRDHIDLTAIAHGEVRVTGYPAGWTNILFDTSGETGSISVHGTIGAPDLILAPDATLIFA